jgi:hypothetical protein
MREYIRTGGEVKKRKRQYKETVDKKRIPR